MLFMSNARLCSGAELSHYRNVTVPSPDLKLWKAGLSPPYNDGVDLCFQSVPGDQ